MAGLRSLTEVEELLLKIVAAQGTERLTPDALAVRAGCRVNTLYELLQDDFFKSLWIAALQKTTAAAVPGILNVFERAAKEGSFRHGKLILEVAGAYTPKTQTELQGSLQVDESPFPDASSRRKFLARLMAALDKEDDPEC